MRNYINYSYIFIICCLIIALVSVSFHDDRNSFISVRSSSCAQFNPDSMVLVSMEKSNDKRTRLYIYHSDIRCHSISKGNVAMVYYYNPPSSIELIPCAYCARIFPEHHPVAEEPSKMKKLYDKLNRIFSNYDWGTEQEFYEGMQIEENRRWLYDLISEKGKFAEPYDFETFNRKLGF